MVAFRSLDRRSVYMLLSVKEMELRKIRFDETFQPGSFDFSDEALEQDSPLRAMGAAELVEYSEGEARVQGSYSVVLSAQCDRCLGRAEFPLEGSFDLYYRPVSGIASEEEVRIDEGESEIGFYDGVGIELEIILREQVLLALPMQRVCGEGCKGICPVCGGNRNEASCHCEDPGANARWAALRDLIH